jgi:hypothetical protein
MSMGSYGGVTVRVAGLPLDRLDAPEGGEFVCITIDTQASKRGFGMPLSRFSCAY